MVYKIVWDMDVGNVHSDLTPREWLYKHKKNAVRKFKELKTYLKDFSNYTQHSDTFIRAENNGHLHEVTFNVLETMD